jgi:hypothetical protein
MDDQQRALLGSWSRSQSATQPRTSGKRGASCSISGEKTAFSPHPDRGGGKNRKPTSKSKAWTNPCDSAMTLERTRTITLPPPPSPCGPLGTGGSDYGNLKLSRHVLAQSRRCGYNFGDDKLDPRKSAEAASDQAVTSNAAVFTTGAGMQKQEKFFV